MAVKAPLLDAAGKKSKDVTLEDSVFGAELKPHLIHEAVRAELNADRANSLVNEVRLELGAEHGVLERDVLRLLAGGVEQRSLNGHGASCPREPRQARSSVREPIP